jgi:hypothetical protein
MKCLGYRQTWIRPVGNGVIRGTTLCPYPKRSGPLANWSYRALRDGLPITPFLGISCLATHHEVPTGPNAPLKLLLQLEVKEAADRICGLGIVPDKGIGKRWRLIKDVIYPESDLTSG